MCAVLILALGHYFGVKICTHETICSFVLDKNFFRFYR